MAIVTTSQNLSAVSYAQAEIIEIRNGATLTISATPATRPGTIQCITSGKLRIENSSTTVPLIFDLHDMNHDLRFEAGGVLEIRGAAMPLGTGTGAAQMWDFTTLFGGVIRHMTYVEVEETAGSGVYMPWPVIAEDPKFNLDCGLNTTIGGATPAAFTAGNTLAGQVLFWHETNRTLRCGDNTNGRAVPTGCAIRIPNIYISNRLLTNQTSVIQIATTGTPTGGTFTLEISREAGTVMGTTAAIAFNATAAAIDTAIEAVTGAGTSTPGGGPLPSVVSITWAGTYANERLGVRVANNSLTGGTNPQVFVYENGAANCSLVDLNPLGTFDAEWVSFSHKFRIITDVFKSFRAVAVGTGCDALQLNSTNGTVEIDGISTVRSPFVAQTRSQVASVLGATSVTRLVNAGKNPGADFIFNVVPALADTDRITSIIFGQRNSGNNRTLQYITCPSDLKITNTTAVGAGITLQNLTRTSMVGIAYADGSLTAQNTLQVESVIFTANCVDCTFASITDAGPMAPRNYIISTDAASSGLKVYGVTTDGANNSAGFLMQCGGLEVANVSYAGLRSNPLLDMPNSYLANNLIARKVFATHGSAPPTAGLDACQGGQYDMVTSTIAGITETFSGVNDFVGGNYTDPSLTPTTGHVTFGPFAAGVGLELTGSAYTDALGAVLLPTAGDTAVITMPFAMHGITGFQSVEPRLYVDAPGAAANVLLAQAPGVPTGGTFTLSFYTSGGTLIGTTGAIAFNASAPTASAAVSGVLGVGNHTTAGTSISAGYSVTLNLGIYAGQSLIMTVNGSALTGGTEPGVAYAYGRARLQTGTELLGSVTTGEFAMRVPGTSWPAYAALTGANLASAFSALTDYAAGGSGLEMRLRLTATQTNPYTRFNQISLPTNVNPAAWTVGDATITFNGPGPTDEIHIVRVSDGTELYTFTGSGTKSFTIGANFDTAVYFRRELASGTILMRTLPATQRLNFGDNGAVPLFYGMEVQLAQSSDVAAIKTAVDAYLDATISSRESEASAATRATTNQTEHDATQAAVAGVIPNIWAAS